MRQIEDRWRINYRDPPNPSEEYSKLINSFKYNESQRYDISKYRTHVFRKYLNNRCTNICLNIKNLNYQTCVSNCYSKFIKSDNLMESCVNIFEDTYKNYKLAGKEYFQS